MEVAKITISGTIGEPDKRLDSLLGDTGVGSYFSSSMLRAFFEKEAPDAEAYEVTIDSPGGCLLYTSPSPRDRTRSRMPSSA